MRGPPPGGSIVPEGEVTGKLPRLLWVSGTASRGSIAGQEQIDARSALQWWRAGDGLLRIGTMWCRRLPFPIIGSVSERTVELFRAFDCLLYRPQRLRTLPVHKPTLMYVVRTATLTCYLPTYPGTYLGR
jgi:hypothetical protein